MSYYSTRSESKLDNDDDDEFYVPRQEVEDELDDGTTTPSSTTPTTTNTYHQSLYHQHVRSTTTSTMDHHHRVRPPPRRSRYMERLQHRIDTTTPSVSTPPPSAPNETTVESSALSRYRLRRAAASSSSSEHTGSRHGLLPEDESSTSFMALIRRHQQREFTGGANDEGDIDVAEEDEGEEEEDYEDEEVDDYDDEEEDDEMDDGSTAVTIRAPTDRRSSTPIWSGTGMASTGSSSDMGTNDILDIGITTQTSTATATSVAPINTDGTDQDELLVGSGSSADGGDTTIAADSTNTTSMVITAVPNLHSLFEKPYLREIGIEDILSFQLSSAKPGNGVEQLYDPSFETYWQSDGISQPHWIQIQLPRRLPVTHVALYLDYQLDESYTPRTVQIETGLTVVQDSSNLSTVLSDAPVMELHEPVGWCIFPIYVPPDPFDTNHSDNGNGGVVINETTMIPRAHWVRVSVVSMHQNGRDTHVRRVALFCQRTSMTVRMPQQHHVSNKLPFKEETKQASNQKAPVKEEDDEDAQNDHEEILLYARTRSTGRNYDPNMLSQSNIRINQQSSLFGTIR